MKCGNLGACAGQIGIVVDHIISDGKTLLTACLRCEDAADLISGLCVAREQSRYLRVLVAVDNKYSIDERPQRRFNEERYDD